MFAPKEPDEDEFGGKKKRKGKMRIDTDDVEEDEAARRLRDQEERKRKMENDKRLMKQENDMHKMQ